MDELSDLEHIRFRPGMYIGDTSERGLHHLFNELLDNAIDQFLANKLTTVRVKVNGSELEFADDGPGLPFETIHSSGQPLATQYLATIRRSVPTADGHTPHVHLGGWGCGLRILTALTERCEVTSALGPNIWRQTFVKGVEDAPAKKIPGTSMCGTVFRLSVDREIFSTAWSVEQIDERLKNAAYLFPGLRVETPTMKFSAERGLADWAAERARDTKASEADQVWWINRLFGDIHIQAAVVGHTDGETQWGAFANGSTSVEEGSHLLALKRVVAACKLKPAVAMIHVIMQNPKFAGPTRTNLDAPEIVSPIFHALKPDLQLFMERS